MSLSGRLALVTGGGSGIGRAVCQVLARDDARVVITDLDIQSCTRTEEVVCAVSFPPDITKVGFIMQELTPGQHLSLAADVSQSDAVNECFQEVLERYKRPPDIIVNSAGITRTNSLLTMNEEDFEKVIDVNLKGTFLVTQVSLQTRDGVTSQLSHCRRLRV